MASRLPYKPVDSSSKALRPAIDLITQALFVIDSSDKIILANDAAQTITGLPESALLENPIATILSIKLSQNDTTPNDLATPELLTLPATVHGLEYSATFVPLTNITYHAEVTPPAALVIVTPDSSPLQNQTATTIYVQFVGNLTLRIAHDLSNSLTSIIGNAELLHEQLNDLVNSPTPQRCASLRDNGLPELLDVIRKSREMAQFITSLREFARQQPINTHTLELNNAITETLAIARSLLGTKIQIDFLASEELPPIFMDRFRIDQLLLSILLTSKNAMPPSGGLIVIETGTATLDQEFTLTHPGARSGTYTRLSVTDSSAGMDSDQVSRFFDFPRKEIFDSADLSIPIAYSIVKRFGGYITVESWPGKGTRFDIYFPSIPTSEEQVLDLDPPLKSEHSTVGIKSSLILIADDDLDVQTTIARYVSKAGYETASTADGKTALRLYRQLTKKGNQPALLIADLGLPEIDGRTLSTIIQNEFRSAPVLLTSGFKIEINTTTGTTRDGFHFLPKPFEPNALLTTIERLLNPT